MILERVKVERQFCEKNEEKNTVSVQCESSIFIKIRPKMQKKSQHQDISVVNELPLVLHCMACLKIW